MPWQLFIQPLAVTPLMTHFAATGMSSCFNVNPLEKYIKTQENQFRNKHSVLIDNILDTLMKIKAKMSVNLWEKFPVHHSDKS